VREEALAEDLGRGFADLDVGACCQGFERRGLDGRFFANVRVERSNGDRWWWGRAGFMDFGEFDDSTQAMGDAFCGKEGEGAWSLC
jgi:hypothetical protein